MVIDMTIKFYKTNEPYGYMNNFHKTSIFIYDNWWNNVEAPYQSRKTLDPAEKKEIWEAATPRKARDLGQKVELVDNWDAIRFSVMRECVLAKFLQNDRLRNDLISTGTEILIEDSPIDYYWGCGADGTGLNMLGQILMSVRNAIVPKVGFVAVSPSNLYF